MSNLTQKDIDAWKVQRWRARTDLEWLCREVLGYKDVTREVHPFLDRLQKFPRPTRAEFAANDIFDGRWSYTPITPLYDLPGSRRRLILDFRGSLKTTCNIIAHTIQWILNYPDIAILVVQATNEKAEIFMYEIKRHFQANPRFRALFPEHCPQKKVFDWGTRSQFTTEARGRGVIRRESTVMTASIDKGTAGLHFDVMKFSDIVEENNSKTADQNRVIVRSFAMMENLLVSISHGWIDVEGTRYHEEDLYGSLIDKELSLKPEDRTWVLYARGCYKKKTPDGAPQKFTPDELDLPYLLDETKPAPVNPDKEPDLRRISWWPERHPTKELEAKRLDPLRGENFASQQLNRPSEYLFSPFPWDEKLHYPRLIPLKYFLQHVRITSYEMSIDTSETAGPRSNATAAFVVGWGEDGLPYVVLMTREKMNPDQVIDLVFRLNAAWAPDKIKIEDVSFNRGLMTGFRHIQDTYSDRPPPIKEWRTNNGSLYLPWEFLKRDNNQRKQERIIQTLQPWYRAKDIVFVDNCSCRTAEDGPRGGTCPFCQTLVWLKREMTGFGVTEHDDMLDALSDIFQGRDWFGRTARREGVTGRVPLLSRRYQYIQDAWERLTGQEPMDKIYDDTAPPGLFPGPYDSFYVNRTGY